MNAPRTFRLYPEARHFWSLTDYGAVLGVVERLKPKRVLEFGPGSSTLALIEGGAQIIDACEDEPHYFEIYQRRLAEVYSNVTMHAYTWSDPLRVPTLSGRWYDLALIDGPRETERRPAVIAYCLERSAAVLVALEDHDTPGILQGPVEAFAVKYGRDVSIWRTGPLAGSFALLT